MAGIPKQKYRLAERSLWAKFCHWLIADPWRKIIALTLAFCFWGVLSLNLNRTENHRWAAVDHVQLHFQSPHGTSINQYYFDSHDISLREISLAVSVDAWSDAQLTAKNFQVRIQPQPIQLRFSNDGVRTQPLETTYTLKETDLVDKPAGVTLRRFNPPEITFRWDGIISKDIPVHFIIHHQLPEQLVYHAPDSPLIHVTGPAFLVNQIHSIDTETIALDTSSPGVISFDSIRLILPSQFNGLALSQDSIAASFEIVDRQRSQTRLIKELRLNYLTHPDNSLVLNNIQDLPRTVSIYVAGPTGLLDDLDSSQLMAVCDLTGYSMPGPQNVPVRIMNLPPELQIASIAPQATLRIVLASPDAP